MSVGAIIDTVSRVQDLAKLASSIPSGAHSLEFHYQAGLALGTTDQYLRDGGISTRPQPITGQKLATDLLRQEPDTLESWEQRLINCPDLKRLLDQQIAEAAKALIPLLKDGIDLGEEGISASLAALVAAMSVYETPLLEAPYHYQYRSDFAEPDWRRIPGYKDVSAEDWRSDRWQVKNGLNSLKRLKEALGPFLTDAMAADIGRDMRERATMGLLIPPHMLNLMNIQDLRNDPVRRYMMAMFSDRDPRWPSHPMASRDSLHESDMTVVPGLTHRYPTKVLAELTTGCPQYCQYCTRTDSVGPSTQLIEKAKLPGTFEQRAEAILGYLRTHSEVRDVVVSGGDVAAVKIHHLEAFVSALLDIEHIKDIRLASKGLMGRPQYFLQDEILWALERLAKKANERGVGLHFHTHISHANEVTPLLAEVVVKLRDMGFRDVRNQGVLARGVNATTKDLLDLCFKLTNMARITPYYFYMCDMIPNSEHWRISLAHAQMLQSSMMGFPSGFHTPRILCDVPFVGKRWTHQESFYDRTLGVSSWVKAYDTALDRAHPDLRRDFYHYYDPIDTLPDAGQEFWAEHYPSASAG